MDAGSPRVLGFVFTGLARMQDSEDDPPGWNRPCLRRCCPEYDSFG